MTGRTDRFGMVVIDGIRYKPADVPAHHKAVLAPEPAAIPVDVTAELDNGTPAEAAPEPEPKRRPKAKA